jgi:hypothetical protein
MWMHEFESFVYLDIEKTGSAFISRLLRRFTSEREIRRDHHAPMNLLYDPAKFYFISVRDPLDCYISLYSFGCGFKGKMRARLEELNLDQCYDGTTEGFNEWLNYVLKFENARTLGEGYDKVGKGRIAKMLGFQSYRYLRLALPSSERFLRKCETQDDVRAAYAENKLPGFVVRYENFTEDLCRLLSGPLQHAIADVDAALDYVRTAEPVNASQRVDKAVPDFGLREKVRNRLLRREWFMHELFEY